MQDIQISSVYFYALNRYIHEKNVLSLFDQNELAQLQEIAAQDFLVKFKLEYFNFYIEKLENAKISKALCFELVQYLDIKHYGIIGYITTHANTFSDAARYLEKFSTLIIDAKGLEQLQFVLYDHSSAVVWPKWNINSIWINEINLATIFRTITQLAQPYPDFKFEKIEFSHAPLMPIEAYQDFYQCELYFNHPHNGLYLNNNHLAKIIPSKDEILLGILLNQAEATLVEINNKNTLSCLEDKLRLLIRHYLEVGEPIPDLETLAASFHQSKRTFQRRLKQENIIYRQFIETTKMQYCKQCLNKPEISLSDLAEQLGYSDQSALGRAFKKNFGISMKKFQQSL